MELSDNSLNDILAFSMEDLFYVYFVNSLSEEKNQTYQKRCFESNYQIRKWISLQSSTAELKIHFTIQ